VNTVANSKAVLSNATPAGICSGGIFNFTPLSTTAVRYSMEKILQFQHQSGRKRCGQSSTTGVISETLTNNTNIQTTVYYAYTMETANGCTNTEKLAVAVNPPTTLSTALFTGRYLQQYLVCICASEQYA
jgi:hypothetical protein